MKRRLSLLLVAASLTTVGMLAPATPASANACAGTGNATLGSPGFGYPVNTNPPGVLRAFQPHTTNFSFTFLIGFCATKNAANVPFAAGIVTGYCGLSSGSGTLYNGTSFSFNSTGTVLVLTGGVVGTGSVIPDPFAAGSCTSGNATKFIVTVAVVVGTSVGPAPRTCDVTITVC